MYLIKIISDKDYFNMYIKLYVIIITYDYFKI
jgi:hypothetical protein